MRMHRIFFIGFYYRYYVIRDWSNKENYVYISNLLLLKKCIMSRMYRILAIFSTLMEFRL